MEILLALVSLILGPWTFVGIPVGIVLSIIYLIKKDKKLKKLILWSFGGVLISIAMLVLYFIVSVAAGTFGVALPQRTLPTVNNSSLD